MSIARNLSTLKRHQGVHLDPQTQTGLHSRDAEIPAFRRMPSTARVLSFRKASWNAIKTGLTQVDSSNVRAVMRVRLPIDFDIAAAAFERLRQRYEVLQVTIEEDSGLPCLRYDQRETWQMERFDLSSRSPETREAEARDIAGALVWQRMELSTGPLFKAFCIRLGPNDHIVGFVVHHLIADGTTKGILLDGFLRCYDTSLQVQNKDSDELEYRDYLLVMSEWAQQSRTRSLLQRWASHLASAATIDLLQLTDAPRNPSPGPEHFEIGPKLTREIDTAARLLRTSRFLILLSVQKMVVAHLSRQHEIVIGGVIDGRELPALQSMAGYLADRVYWRTDLDGNPTFAEILERVRASVVTAMDHQFLRSDMVMETLADQGRRMIAPVFNFMPLPQSARAAKGMPRRPIEEFELPAPPSITTPTPNIAYWMTLADAGTSMRGRISYSKHVLPEILPRFLGILARVVEDTKCTLEASRSCWYR